MTGSTTSSYAKPYGMLSPVISSRMLLLIALAVRHVCARPSTLTILFGNIFFGCFRSTFSPISIRSDLRELVLGTRV